MIQLKYFVRSVFFVPYLAMIPHSSIIMMSSVVVFQNTFFLFSTNQENIIIKSFLVDLFSITAGLRVVHNVKTTS